jgi:hypothetical protein
MEGESGRGFDGLRGGGWGVKGEASECCGWWGTKESGCTASRAREEEEQEQEQQQQEVEVVVEESRGEEKELWEFRFLPQ